jgi:hypothetical protein
MKEIIQSTLLGVEIFLPVYCHIFEIINIQFDNMYQQ